MSRIKQAVELLEAEANCAGEKGEFEVAGRLFSVIYRLNQIPENRKVLTEEERIQAVADPIQAMRMYRARTGGLLTEAQKLVNAARAEYEGLVDK